VKTFDKLIPDYPSVSRELVEFRTLLSSKEDLGERSDILGFFKERRQLCSFIASAHGVEPDRIAYEYDLFGDFRVDLVVGKEKSQRYFFIEFEDAKPDSLFKKSDRSTTIWGTRVSGAFYQIVDWFWKLNNQAHSPEFEMRFGSRSPEVTGVIIVGRNTSVSEVDRTRLKWLTGNLMLKSSNIFIYTFDDLLALLEEKLKSFEEFAKSIE
jgi:hypothetical protein